MVNEVGLEPTLADAYRVGPGPAMAQAGPRPLRTVSWQGIAVVVVAALAVRLVHVWGTSDVPTARHLIGDAAGYYDWAVRIAGGAWVGTTGFYQAPLYPYVLGTAFWAFGTGTTTIRLLQAVWGALACGAMAWGASGLLGRRAGRAAGWMLALYGPAVYFDGIVQKASLTGLLVCGLLASVAWVLRRRGTTPLVVVGFFLGLLCITRENAMVWVPVFAWWAWRRSTGATSRTRSAQVIALLAGVAFVLAPVAVRNRAVSGEWSVSTFQAGPNFYIGNHRGADGRYQPLVRGHETPEFERHDATLLAQRAVGRTLTQREVSRYWFGRAWDEIRADVPAWLMLMGRKLLLIVNRYEIADAESYYLYRESSMVLNTLGPVGHFGVLAPLGAIGLVVTWKDRRRLWVVHALVATMITAVAAFFVLARYRHPVAILLIPFAGAGVVHLWDALRSREALRWRAVAVSLLVALIVNLSVQDEKRLTAMSWMNAGVALAQAGQLPAAETHFRRAVGEHPSSPEAHNNLAQALALRGAYAEAIEHYEVALSLDPRLIGVPFNLGVALERSGRSEEALRAYERAVELNPADAEAKAAVRRLTLARP